MHRWEGGCGTGSGLLAPRFNLEGRLSEEEEKEIDCSGSPVGQLLDDLDEPRSVPADGQLADLAPESMPSERAGSAGFGRGVGIPVGCTRARAELKYVALWRGVLGLRFRMIVQPRAARRETPSWARERAMRSHLSLFRFQT